ncbi:MAG TPA: HAMP domain-containing sensor histidine kinase [Bacteroidota bacterium]
MSSEHEATKDSELAYLQTTLQNIQRLKDDLVTQIAHDFRTPLTSVIGFAEILLDDRPLTDEQRIEYTRFIQYEGIRLSKLIDDLIELSSLEGGTRNIDAHSFDVRDIVAAAIGRVSEFARGRLVTLRTEPSPVPVMARCDCEKIAQALYQLLHNAVRFTKPHTEVTISVTSNDDSLEIRIRDLGPGIAQERIPKLLQNPGCMPDPDQDHHATGVGLAIVKHIADLHGGRVNIQSNKGEGSVFTLQIPCSHSS